MKRLLPLVVSLAVVAVLALPVSAAGASSGPEKGLGAICQRVQGGAWDAGSLTCEGLHIELPPAASTICEGPLHGLVAYLAIFDRGLIPNGWACDLPPAA